MTTKSQPELQDAIEQYYELTEKVSVIEDEHKSNPAYKLLPLVKTRGDDKGGITTITPQQFRKYMGYAAPPSIIKDNRIRWELALDQLATSEHGSFRSDDELKSELERLAKERDSLKDLRIKRDYYESVLRDNIPEKDVQVIIANAPVFPRGEDSKAIQVKVNGYTLIAKRNPPFYQIQDNNASTPDIRVRYAADARRLMNRAARGYTDEQARSMGLSTPNRKVSDKDIKPLELVMDDDIMPDTSPVYKNVKRPTKTKRKPRTDTVTITSMRGMR